MGCNDQLGVCMEKDLIDKLKKQNGVLENSAMEIKIFETMTIFNARMKIDQIYIMGKMQGL